MTPKQEYEARKAERRARADRGDFRGGDSKDTEMVDLFDRFVTAVERIAENLENRR